MKWLKYFMLSKCNYSSVRLATALIANIIIHNLYYHCCTYFLYLAFNVNFVPLIASSPISNEFRTKCECYYANSIV